MAALLLPWAISPRISRSRGVSRSIGDDDMPARADDQLLDHLGIDDRAAGGHGANRVDQLVGVADTILEQVGPAVGAGLQQAQRVRRRRVVAEHDDTRPTGGSRGSGPRPARPRQSPSAACGCR